MAGKRQQVDGQRLHIDRDHAGSLRRVHQKQQVMFARDAGSATQAISAGFHRTSYWQELVAFSQEPGSPESAIALLISDLHDSTRIQRTRERQSAVGAAVIISRCHALTNRHLAFEKPHLSRPELRGALLVTGDLRDAEDVDRALSADRIDRVIHTAAMTPNAQRERDEPRRIVEVNVVGTVNLLERAAARPAIRRVVVLSSVAVYGFSEPAPSGLFENSNPFDSQTNYTTNCSNPLLSAQQLGAIGCTPALIAADTAAPGSALANIEIGRRNVEGGPRSAYYEHTNYRAVVGAKGDFADAWNYDAYGSYYYTTFFNSNNGYLNFQAIDNALLVTGTAANPSCISGPPCVPYNIWNQGAVTRAQTDPMLQTGTAYGTVTERILHVDVTGDLGKYGIKLPTANDGVGVNDASTAYVDEQTVRSHFCDRIAVDEMAGAICKRCVHDHDVALRKQVIKRDPLNALRVLLQIGIADQ